MVCIYSNVPLLEKEIVECNLLYSLMSKLLLKINYGTLLVTKLKDIQITVS